MRKFFCTCLLVFMKESVRAEQFLCVKHALQYVNGHAVLGMGPGPLELGKIWSFSLKLGKIKMLYA